MAYFGKTFFFIACFLFSQFDTQATIFGNSSQNDLLTNSIRNILNTVQSSLNQTRNLINSLKSSTRQTADQIIDEFTITISNISKECAIHCKELLLNSSTISESAANCTQDCSDEIDSIFNETLNNFKDCVHDIVDNSMNITDALFNNTILLTRIISRANDGLNNCTKLSGGLLGIISPEVISCKTRLLATLTPQAAQSGVKTAADIVRGLGFIGATKAKFTACRVSAVAEARQEKARIYAEITECLNETD